jgi:hypothetical protein
MSALFFKVNAIELEIPLYQTSLGCEIISKSICTVKFPEMEISEMKKIHNILHHKTKSLVLLELVTSSDARKDQTPSDIVLFCITLKTFIIQTRISM